MSEKIQILPEELPSFFKKQLKNPDAVFVFQTDVVKNSWADWCVSHPEESGVQAVELDRFMAWDKFKAEYVSSVDKTKDTIPAILRTFFINSLISQNAALPEGNTIFKKIINPAFRKESFSFTDWIVSILPSLKLLEKTINSAKEKGYIPDEEDEDFLKLYGLYSDFLKKNNLYEPNWIEPDFTESGKKFFIIYPEILKDYSDYIAVFDSSNEISVINLPESAENTKEKCIKYPDARKELRRTILQIRKLHSENVRWDEISLNVPDLENCRPYIERELTEYNVPFVIKAGFPLTLNTAGKIFSEIQDCHDSNFSYESMRTLLLDEFIPWKSEFKDVRQHLIQEGNRLRCICGFNETVDGKEVYFDSWEQALRETSSTNNRELELYRNLKHEITSICRSKSFKDIMIAWLSFKKTYLSETDFTKEADAIIGRCITELSALNEIETKYCTPESGLKISNHYDFFVTELSKKTYTPQNAKTGLSVYPYRTSAGAFFRHQFVISASQKNLEILYKKLNFLKEEKRKALNLTENDRKFNASEAFTHLYHSFDENGKNIVHFSFAEESFQGFSICHNSLEEEKACNDFLDEEDFILNEKKYMLGKNYSLPLRLTENQKNRFSNFRAIVNKNESSEKETSVSQAVTDRIKFYLTENRSGGFENPFSGKKQGKIVITQSDMKDFFPCPRKWIFSKVINLKEDSLDTVLMQTYDSGNINHKILELFMKDYLDLQKPLPVSDSETGIFSESDENEIYGKIRKYSEIAINEKSKDYAKSPLTRKMLESQLDQISKNIMDFLHQFLQENGPSTENITKTSKTKGYGGCIVRGVEKSYFVLNEDKNYSLYGKIDLLLTGNPVSSATDGWTIIDYKNKKVPSLKDITFQDGKHGDFQMPMYISLIQKNEKVTAIDSARFYSIKDGSTSCAVDIFTKDKTIEDFENPMNIFKEYTNDFEKKISSQNFSPESNKVDLYEDCIKCNFSSICRRTYEVFKKK